MAFDAGTVIARMDLDDAEFDRKLRADVAKIEAFEKRTHEARINVEMDESGMQRARRQFERFDRQVTQDAQRRSRGMGSVLGALSGLFGGGRGGIGGGLAGAAGPAPNWGPIGTRAALIAAGGGLGLGALPALAAPLLAGGVGLGGVSVAGLLGMQAAKPATALVGAQSQAQAALAAAVTPAQRLAAQQQLQAVNQQVKQLSPALQSVFHSLSGFQTWWKGFTASLAPSIVGPIHTITSVLEHLGPTIRQVFAGAMTVIVPFVRGLGDVVRMIGPGLSQAFRAAAPLMRPLLDGLGMLVKGLMPGLVALLRAAMPAVVVFAQILGTLGRDLGSMLRIFAPVLRQSSVILKALLDVVSALFPIIGKLAAVFARDLAPVVVQFAAVIRSLLPFLVTIGHVIAALAGAALRDLVTLFGALARLLLDISPAIGILARALSQMFSVLESAGVFGALSSALEMIVPVLAQFINLLVRQLAPDLPLLTQALAVFSNVLITLVAAGLTAVLQGLTWMLRTFPFLVPVLGVVAAAWLAWNLVMTANPIGLIIVAIAALIGAIVLVARHWGAVWGGIRDVAMSAWNFLTHGWGQWLIPGLTLIRWAVGLVEGHWRAAWNGITGAASSAWNFLTHGWGQFLFPELTAIRWAVSFLAGHWADAWHGIVAVARDAWGVIKQIGALFVDLFTLNMPGAAKIAVRLLGDAWGGIENAIRAPVAWVIDHVLDGLISAFDWVTSHMGLGRPIPQVHPFGLATGGRIPGYGGGDRKLIAVEPGEAVVSKETTAANAGTLAAWGVPGFQRGGIPAPVSRFGTSAGPAHGPLLGGVTNILSGGGRIIAAIATGNVVALTNALRDLFPHGAGGASAQLGAMLLALPGVLVKDAVHWLIGRGTPIYSAKFGGSYGAGVSQWRPDVLRVLAMLGLPLMLASRVLYQMQTESGGSPNAINLTDSNAMAGDPSRGLLQTIMSTFLAYAGPFRNRSIYDPMANIYAAVNYAAHRYGPSLMSGGMGMGSGHGYQRGSYFIPQTGPAMLHRGEMVIPAGEAAAVRAGGGVRDVYLMLPEGTTVAQAMRELSWVLTTSRQQAFTGVAGG